eukprot:TRINITY_DN51160_c0_g1_i1.p1 TRINITY_DN51160_c0_g1~~TRINITY_DN51160_c0_g1_i1.p1  ORF type:complete len:321 (+),score=56.96 TRINITY_DN51160_c0_g1_i1:70-1032(+)
MLRLCARRAAAGRAAAARAPPRAAGGLPAPAPLLPPQLSLCRRWASQEASGRFPDRATPHEILGVSRTATAEEIRAAYQRLITQVHPDRGGTDSDFHTVQAAYRALQDGPPPHMVYGRDPDTRPQVLFWQRVQDALAKLGLHLNWRNAFDRYDVQGTRTTRYCVIALSVLWFCYVCEPAQPQYLIYMAMAYAWDVASGGWLLGVVLLYLWWRSMHDRLVDGLFNGPHAYWDIGRPTALTMGMGIPNYWWSPDSEVVMDRARQMEANKKGYARILGAGVKDSKSDKLGADDDDDDDDSAAPPTAAERLAKSQKNSLRQATL